MAGFSVQPSEIDALTVDEFLELHEDLVEYLERTKGGIG
jgi:hypothetical protein